MNNLMVYVLSALLVLFMLIVLPIMAQYHKHKAPLKIVDPNVQYGFFHHIKIVTIPVIKYRLSKKKPLPERSPVVTPDQHL